jgi:hypothetical protein
MMKVLESFGLHEGSERLQVVIDNEFVAWCSVSCGGVSVGMYFAIHSVSLEALGARSGPTVPLYDNSVKTRFGEMSRCIYIRSSLSQKRK